MTDRFHVSELVFAMISVAGATAACADHGDAATAEVLSEYYTLVADTIRSASGRVVKVIGDGVLAAFPASRAHEAVAVLRSVQTDGTELWQRFDHRCHIQVKAGIGPVMTGPFGPSGEERDDIYGDALNRLFKMKSDVFVLSPELSALLL
ncbi:MAG TPA: adenylate/guanylate cyclase domain-containing protein [Thermoanaerobaculia bacterium]|jgi:class 3 adenylate cyclase